MWNTIIIDNVYLKDSDGGSRPEKNPSLNPAKQLLMKMHRALLMANFHPSPSETSNKL